MENGSAFSTINDCTYWCPTAMGQDVWQLYVLSVLYMGVGLLVGLVVIIDAHENGDYTRLYAATFRNLLLYTSFIFCILRGLIFLIDWEYTVLSLVWVNVNLPLYFQFVMFSLLVVFLIKCQLIMHKAKETWTKKLYLWYGVFLLGIFGLMGLVSYLQADNIVNKMNVHNTTDGLTPAEGETDLLLDWKTLSIWSSSVYTAIVLLVGGLGLKTYLMTRRIGLSDRKRSQVHRFWRLVVMYFIVFVFRSVWNILNVCDANPLQNWITNQETTHKIDGSDLGGMYSVMLTFYVLIEVFPTAVTVMSFCRWADGSGKNNVAQTHEERQIDFRTRQRNTANYGSIVAQTSIGPL